MIKMTRREFLQRTAILGLSASALALLDGCGIFPAPTPTPKIARIGYLATTNNDNGLEPFRQGLRELGYVEGQNIMLEIRSAEGKPERFPELAADLVRAQIDIIIAPGTVTAQAAQKATSTIPIIFTNPADPVGSGLVASLAHPGGNITGLATNNAVLLSKRWQLLKDAFPQISRVAYVFPANDPTGPLTPPQIQDAQSLGLTLDLLGVQETGQFDVVFETATKDRVEALMVAASPFFGPYRPRIVELANKTRLPAMYAQREFVDAGGLMSYAANFSDQSRRAATYVDKILKGAKPADLPVQNPIKFEFVINLKAAKGLGLTIPRSILEQATEVIQ